MDLKIWAGGGAKNDNDAGEAHAATAKRANEVFLRAAAAGMQHDAESERRFLDEGIALLKRCGNAPWPPSPNYTCAEVLAKKMKERRRLGK